MLFSVWRGTIVNCCTIGHALIINTLLGERITVGLVHLLNWYVTMRSSVGAHHLLLSLRVARVDTCSFWGYRNSIWHEVHVRHLIGPFLTHVHPDRQLAVVPIISIHCHLLLKWIFLLAYRLCWLYALRGECVGLIFHVMFFLWRLFDFTACHDLADILMSWRRHSKLLHRQPFVDFLASIQQSALVLHL